MASVNKILGKHTHAGPYFEYRHTLIHVKSGGNALRDRLVGKKMLAESLFGFNFLHGPVNFIN